MRTIAQRKVVYSTPWIEMVAKTMVGDPALGTVDMARSLW
jgi:hypothetical protein